VSILINKETRVAVQGITGYQGEFHTARMLEFGTQVVAGVTPGKGGMQVHGVPVFETVAEAVRSTGANAACVFVPARFAMDAALEAIEARLDPVAIITEGIPVHDVLPVVEFARQRGVRVVGPNCPGVTSPGRSKIGIMPNDLFTPGPAGVISRSGTLTYEIVAALTRERIGQSTAVGLGGDPVVGIDARGGRSQPLVDRHPVAVTAAAQLLHSLDHALVFSSPPGLAPATLRVCSCRSLMMRR